MERNTIDNNNLEHGLGVGGGRGRPKGSRNGYINPNAAYMKNYEIQGEVADPLNTGLQPQNQQRQRTWAPAPQSNGPTRRMTNQEINTRRAAANNTTRTAPSMKTKPASSMQTGKSVIEKLLGNESVDVARTAGNPKLQPISNGQNPGVVKEVTSDIAGALNDTKEAVEEMANAVGNELNKAVNGQDYQHTDIVRNQGDPKIQQVSEERHDNGILDDLGNAWNGLLNWGKNAWNDISEVATSAIDTGRGWAKSGLDWLNNNVLNPASEWGSRAVSDVSSWIGDRGRDLDRWWNGYDETVRNPSSGETRMQGDLKGNARQTQHVNGVSENVGNWLDQAGRDVAAIPGRVGNAVDQAGQWIGDRAEDVNRWWNGYDVAPTGSPEDRARRQAGETDHVNGARENIGNLLNQTGQNIAAIPGRIGEAVDTMWNGNQVIRGNENGVTSVEGTPGLADRLFNGYVQERRVDAPANEDRRHGVANDQYAQDRVFERVAPLTEQIGNGLNQVGRDIAAIPGQVGNLVQRNIVDPVTGAVKTYLVDPITNTAVAVADAVQTNVINPVRGAVQQFDQNIVQPSLNAMRTAADWTNENFVQPVGNFVGEQARNAGEAIGNGFEYLGYSGDGSSNGLRQAGVNTSVVDDLNRSAAYGDDQTRESVSRMKSAMSVAVRNGIDPQNVNYVYAAMKQGIISPDAAMNIFNGWKYATPDAIMRDNAYYQSMPYGMRQNGNEYFKPNRNNR